MDKMQNNKAPCYDDISMEMLPQYGSLQYPVVVQSIYENMGWKKPSMKIGKKELLCQFPEREMRRITLLSHIFKIYKRILASKLIKIIEDMLKEQQHAFRQETSTIDLIFHKTNNKNGNWREGKIS